MFKLLNLACARLYIPTYELVPEAAISLLTEHKKRVVEYKDVNYFTIQNVQPGANVNQQLASNLTNMKGVVVIPQLAQSFLGVRADQSPFDSNPATSSPLSLYNFNISLSNKNVYQANQLYSFESLMYELKGCNAINGGLTNAITSGLLSKTDFENAYHYYYVNLERRLKDDMSGKSISVLCTNNNRVPIDLVCFVVVKKTMIIDIETGQIESIVS